MDSKLSKNLFLFHEHAQNLHVRSISICKFAVDIIESFRYRQGSVNAICHIVECAEVGTQMLRGSEAEIYLANIGQQINQKNKSKQRN